MKKWAQKPLKQLGFTVVETLIVLAVTSGLFVISAVVIQGKQSKTNFQIGTKALQQQLQQIINETASGYYPNNSGFTCNVTPSPNVTFTNVGSELGQNTDCVFAGKVVVFNSTAKDKYTVYSLAGRRTNAGADVTSAQDAKIAAIPSSTETHSIPNGFEFYAGKKPPIPSPDTSKLAIAFLPSFATYSTGSGAQQLQLHSFNNGWSYSDDIDNINTEASTPSNYPLATNGMLLCVQNPGTGQSALYTITSGLEVRLEVKSGMTCTW